jgi:hypothetical protein
MKKHLILGTSLVLGLMLSLASCNGDDTPGPGNTTKSINSLFQELRSTPQIFTVTAGVPASITGANGTKITFNSQSFKDLSGNMITSGDIKIELIEMYKPGQMITNRVTTTTVGQKALTSGGSVKIRASQNNHEIFANSYSIAFKQPAYSENPMALFTGTQAEDGNVRWNEDSTGTVPRTEKDPANQQFYYAFDSCTSFSWINCDYFYSAPSPKTDVTVVAPDNSYDQTNTQVFIVFPAMNSVSSLLGYNTAAHSFNFGFTAFHLPVGTVVHIMILGSKNNEYFMDLHQNVTVTNGMSVNFTPTTTTLSNIQTALAGL